MRKLIILLTLLSTNILGQSNRYYFDYLTIYDGLSQSVPISINQDNDGFIWIGTIDGLNKYDGFELKNYYYDIHSQNSICNNYINTIYSDSEGVLWIGTKNGLCLYNNDNEIFKSFQQHPADNDSISDNEINAILEDSQHKLWIATNNGLNLYDRKKSKFTAFYANKTQVSFRSIIEVSNNILWIGTDRGIYLFDIQKRTFSFIEIPAISQLKITCLTKKNNQIWIGTEDGLFIYSTQNNKIISNNHKNEDSSKNYIHCIFNDNFGKTWVGTDNGLDIFNGTKIIDSIKSDESSLNSLLNNSVRTIFQDKTGVIWIGTIGGVNKFDPTSIKFHHYKTGNRQFWSPFPKNKQTNDLIWSFAEDSDRNIWIGTRNHGLFKYPPNTLGTDNFVNYLYSGDNLKSIAGNIVYHIYIESDSSILLCTNEGLDIFNPKNNKFKHHKHEDKNTYSIANNVALNGCMDKQGYYWVATINGLSRFDRSTEKFITFRNDASKPNSISSNFISAINCDEDGLLWISTSNGLNILDPKLINNQNYKFAKFKKYLAISGQTNSLSDNYINSSFIDQKGRLWVCTSNGLNLYNKNVDGFTSFKVKDGLPSNNIYMIIEDNKGFLWMSSNGGISKFDPEKKKFVNYTIKNGLQSNEFNACSGFKSKDGMIFFGGINGYNVFHPDSIISKSIIPKIIIKKLKVFQNEIKINEKYHNQIILNKSIVKTKELILNYKNNFIEFEFAAMDYTNPSQNQYAYYLENFDEDWIYSGNRNFARYTNVPHGEYILHIRACNSDYVWNNEGIKLPITIKPPFWKTKLFYAFSLIFLLAAIYFTIKLREYKLKESKRTLENEIKIRTHEIAEANEELKHSGELIEAIFNHAMDGIVVLNSDGYTLMSNPAYEEITGYAKLELASIPYLKLIPGKWKRYIVTNISKLNKQKKAYVEYECIRKDGKLVALGVAVTKMKINNPDESYLAIVRDITSKKKSEKELDIYRTGLENLVKKRTEDLHTAKEKAESAERLKSSFLQNLSHEIRTPMNAILGFSQLLENGTRNESEIQKYTSIISQNSLQLLELLDNIITLSKYETEGNSILKDIIIIKELFLELHKKYNAIKASMEKKNLSLKYNFNNLEESYSIYSDKNKINQVFIILLDNAFKFTEEGSIEFGCKKGNEPNQTIFYVKDTGIGIPKDKIEEIFLTFTKVDDRLKSKLYRGVGLGLALAKHIINKFDGKIWCESSVGDGSIFYFTVQS